jgi:pectate lyase
VRFGNPVHVYNNFYAGNEYGVASTMNAGVLVEGNYFENVDEPTPVGYADSDPGTLVQRSNHFVGSGAPESAGSVARIPLRLQPGHGERGHVDRDGRGRRRADLRIAAPEVCPAQAWR